MRPITTAVLVLVFASHPLPAQWSSRLHSTLPSWADSALTSARFWETYDFTSYISPLVGLGDLDGDGLWDVAIGIVDKGGRRRGVAIVHQIDRSVHIVGVGQPLSTGRAGVESWGLAALTHERAAIRVADWHVNGWFAWDGTNYVWVPDSP